MVPTHGGFDLRRDHGFRNPPVLPFRVLGAPGAWQQGTAAPPPPPPRSDNLHQRHHSQWTAEPPFNFRRAPAPWGPPDAGHRLRHPYHPQPQLRGEGRWEGVEASAPPRSSAGRDGAGGGDAPPRGESGGGGEMMKDPASASAPTSTSPPRSAAGAGGGDGRNAAGSSAVHDAVPAGDRVNEEEGGRGKNESGRSTSVATDALQVQPAAASMIPTSSAAASAASAAAAAAAEGSPPGGSGPVHPGYDPYLTPAFVVPGVEAAGDGTGAGGWKDEVVLQRDVVLGAGVGGMLVEEDGHDEEDGEEGWAMSKEWEEHLRNSPSVQRYLQRMQAKPSTWKDWRGGKKRNKKKSVKKSTNGSGGGGGSRSGSNNNNSSSSVGATADNSPEKHLYKGGNTDKTSPSSSSAQQQQHQQPQQRDKQQQQQREKHNTKSVEKKGDKKKKPSKSSSKRGEKSASEPAPALSPRTAAKQALELELAKIEAHALLYAEQQQHRPLEDAVIPSPLTLF